MKEKILKADWYAYPEHGNYYSLIDGVLYQAPIEGDVKLSGVTEFVKCFEKAKVVDDSDKALKENITKEILLRQSNKPLDDFLAGLTGDLYDRTK